ncbi:MAG TPA: YetF domain-containing protein [Candidatus Dormibacteraeota bacterium]
MPSIPAWELIVRAILIYVALLVALRIFGKREVGQFTLYDLVFILLVANALQPAITGPDNSLGGGLVLIIALVLTNAGVGWLDRFPRFHKLLAAPPAVIIKDGEYLRDVMKKEGVDQEEVETAMREHGVADVKEVQLGVLEPDGSISIVATGGATRTKRRVRFSQRSR